jgi:hypothetical protein
MVEHDPKIKEQLDEYIAMKTGGDKNGKGKSSNLVSVKDERKLNPITGEPLSDRLRKSINVDPDTIKQIIAHAKAKGIDPYDALAISYQETGINKDAPYNLNPDYFKSNTGDAKYGVQTIVDQMKYAKDLQKRGLVSPGDTALLQGYNGYGKIHRGHADLEGATSIYGYKIPDEGIDFKKKPLYGEAVISLRDEILKNNKQIKEMVDNTPAYSEPPAKKVIEPVSVKDTRNELPPQIYKP